jgi:hypothetical protein
MELGKVLGVELGTTLGEVLGALLGAKDGLWLISITKTPMCECLIQLWISISIYTLWSQLITIPFSLFRRYGFHLDTVHLGMGDSVKVHWMSLPIGISMSSMITEVPFISR